MKKRNWIILASLFCIAITIVLFAMNSDVVESFYSVGLYPFISSLLRLLIGWIPFSVGDLLYVAVVVFFAWKLIRYTRAIRRRQVSVSIVKYRFYRLVIQLLMIYILFNFLWGLNYDRKDIAAQMNIETARYSVEELKQINGLLIGQVNKCKKAVVNHNLSYASTEALFEKTYAVYQNVSTTYPFLAYKHRSVKKSFFGVIGNYLGFSGYYNPFSGEAQVNTTIPAFLQPFVTCHEVAHQLGYAKENEANFAGYIAATSSDDSLFMYSAYLDIFLYANRNLRRTDSVSSKMFFETLSPEVKKDIRTIKEFYAKYENPVEPYITWLYGKYLQSNRQPSGILSYNEVVSNVVGYYKKYGRVGGR